MNLFLDILPILFLAFIALIAVWSWGGMRYRWTVYFSALLGMLLIISSYADIIGHPSPFVPEKSPLISYVLDEPRAIYVWLMVKGKPYAAHLPWSIEMAQQLTTLKEKIDGGYIVFERGEFHEVPPPPDQPKD